MFEVKHLTISYGTKKIIDDLSFKIKDQTILAVLGPSGSGKTTLLNAITDQIPYQGEILLNDQNVTPKKMALALVLQEKGLLPWKKVRVNILLGAKIKQQDISSEKLAHLCETLELTELLERYPYQLSGGQKQRVALARAFLLSPDLMMLDEAFSALDTVTKSKAQRLFLEQWQKEKVTTIIVTHDLTEALLLSDQLLLLNDANAILLDNPLKEYSYEKRKQAKFLLPEVERLERIVKERW